MEGAADARGGDVTVVHLPEIGIRGQHTPSILGPEQSGNSGPDVQICRKKRLELER